MTRPVGVAVLGLGSIGTMHARALGELRDRAELRAFSGGDERRCAEAGWPGAVRLEPEELMERADVDVVAVCSPSEHHARQAVRAIEAGKHVLVEKPLALTVADADRVVALAARHKRLAAVMSQRRFEAEYRAVKQLLADGTLGRLRVASTEVHWWRDDDYYRAAPWRSTAAGGGSLMNQGVHNVDLLQWLCGPVAEVTAQYATLAHDIDAEDTTVATLRFASGALGMLSTSTATPPGSPATVTLHLDRGVVELGQGDIVRWDVDGVPRPSATGDSASGAADPGAISISGHVAQWRDVLDALREGRAPAVPAEEGAATVRLLRAVYQAAETGRAVRPGQLS